MSEPSHLLTWALDGREVSALHDPGSGAMPLVSARDVLRLAGSKSSVSNIPSHEKTRVEIRRPDGTTRPCDFLAADVAARRLARIGTPGARRVAAWLADRADELAPGEGAAIQRSWAENARPGANAAPSPGDRKKRRAAAKASPAPPEDPVLARLKAATDARVLELERAGAYQAAEARLRESERARVEARDAWSEARHAAARLVAGLAAGAAEGRDAAGDEGRAKFAAGWMAARDKAARAIEMPGPGAPIIEVIGPDAGPGPTNPDVVTRPADEAPEVEAPGVDDGEVVVVDSGPMPESLRNPDPPAAPAPPIDDPRPPVAEAVQDEPAAPEEVTEPEPPPALKVARATAPAPPPRPGYLSLRSYGLKHRLGLPESEVRLMSSRLAQRCRLERIATDPALPGPGVEVRFPVAVLDAWKAERESRRAASGVVS